MSALLLFHPKDTGQAAVFSPCRTWRYALERRWGSGPFAMFVGLNPSTADETVDDPTIRRCIRFAKDWGYGGLLMGNLFAYRATDPRVMARAADPVGPDNDVWLTTLSNRAGLVVAAWGAHPLAADRATHAIEALGPDVRALGMTKDGHPRHPLYMRADCTPEPFAAASSREGELMPVEHNDYWSNRRIAQLEAERDRYRKALEEIADDKCMVVHDEGESWIDTGMPGKIARAALSSASSRIEAP